MEPRTNNEERPTNDAKALVVALTEQLRGTGISGTGQEQQHGTATSATTLGTAMVPEVENTGNSSSDINANFFEHVEESFPLPDFLAESQVRAALHRAVNAHAQEAFSDEAPPLSHFPSLRPMELGGGGTLGGRRWGPVTFILHFGTRPFLILLLPPRYQFRTAFQKVSASLPNLSPETRQILS